MINIKVKKLDPGVPPPLYATKGSVGADLYLSLSSLVRTGNISQEDFNDPDFINDIYNSRSKTLTIPPNRIMLLGTGISLEIPDGYEVQVRNRSSTALKGLILLNGIGTIDSDYRGEILLPVINLGASSIVLNNYTRIVQIVIAKTVKVEFEIDDRLSETDRGSGGFGSTGK